MPILTSQSEKVRVFPTASWKGVILSIMGRVQLVNSVIQGMLMYNFFVYAWPASILKQLDSWIRNFVWSRDAMQRKIIIVAWHKICCPKADGGLGIRSMVTLNRATMIKLAFEFISCQEQWAQLLRARVFRHGKVRTYISSSI